MNTTASYIQSEKPSSKTDLPPQQFLNMPYGNNIRQVVDVYLPENRSVETTKSLILIHGGGWNSGSKEEFSTYIESFKTRLPGYAFFNLNYRLVNGGNLFPNQEEDVKTAVDFIAANAEKFGVNQDKFVLLGVSAGAHLALLQAYKHTSPTIQAVVDYFGPTDLVAMYQKPWHPLVPLALQMVTGTTPAQNQELFRSSSPISFVTPQSSPTLIFHGSKDQVVDVSQSTALAQKLKAEGVVHEMKIYPAERHGRWYGQALTNSFDSIEGFLKRYVK